MQYLSSERFISVNSNCDPILNMAISQQQLREMFERKKHIAKLNPDYHMGYAEAADLCLASIVAMPSKRSKYGNIKVEHDGMRFDSKKELKCWQELKLREKAGEIMALCRQVPYDLIVNGQKIGKFTADFTWYENGEGVVADCKSPVTRKDTAYRLRKRIFEAQYAPLTIREL